MEINLWDRDNPTYYKCGYLELILSNNQGKNDYHYHEKLKLKKPFLPFHNTRFHDKIKINLMIDKSFIQNAASAKTIYQKRLQL